jgi:PAS domain S-box-containing protein
MIRPEGLLAAVQQAADAIVITDAIGTIEFVNPAFSAMTGYFKEEALVKNPRILKSGRQSEAFYDAMWSTLLSREVWQGEITNRREGGTLFDGKLQAAPVKDSNAFWL